MISHSLPLYSTGRSRKPFLHNQNWLQRNKLNTIWISHHQVLWRHSSKSYDVTAAAVTISRHDLTSRAVSIDIITPAAELKGCLLLWHPQLSCLTTPQLYWSMTSRQQPQLPPPPSSVSCPAVPGRSPGSHTSWHSPEAHRNLPPPLPPPWNSTRNPAQECRATICSLLSFCRKTRALRAPPPACAPPPEWRAGPSSAAENWALNRPAPRRWTARCSGRPGAGAADVSWGPGTRWDGRRPHSGRTWRCRGGRCWVGRRSPAPSAGTVTPGRSALQGSIPLLPSAPLQKGEQRKNFCRLKFNRASCELVAIRLRKKSWTTPPPGSNYYPSHLKVPIEH